MTIPEISKTEHRSSRPVSPVNSVMSTSALSAAASQRSKTSFFGKWTQRTVRSPLLTVTSAALSNTDPIVDKLILKNSRLRGQNEELKEVSDINRSTLEKLACDLNHMGEECTELRRSLCMFSAELKQPTKHSQTTVQSSLTVYGDLQDKLNSVQDKLDFTQECKKILKHSLREKEEEIAILEGKLQCAQNNKSKRLTPREAVSLQDSLNNEQSQIILLHRSVVDKDNQSSSVRADLYNAQYSCKQLLHQRDQLSHRVTGHDEQLSALHLENDILANRVAVAERTVEKVKTLLFSFKQQR
jgi:hypothetical protein